MAYKSLLCVISDWDHCQPALAQSVSLAKSEDAHLEVLCLGVDLTQVTSYYAGANAVILQETISRAMIYADNLKEQVQGMLKHETVRWSTFTSVAALADLGRHIAARSRFSDLVVLPHPYGDDVGPEHEPVTEAALFEGRAPVLVVPNKGEPSLGPQRVVIGWNESAEAMAAVRASLPALKRASWVNITVIDPPVHGPNRADPGGMLSQYLARHGVTAEITVLSKTLPRVSDVLIRHVIDCQADLIVMGAYGHSRLREAIFGGATRDMLEEAKAPLFLAH
ncbi:MAG: universal stress protein [Paracoccaceae bacterium]|nr:universal stress protein [Paracoccaceae bacterium]MDG2258612.1 universal stress protein [Paracoccaceae bacterium]